MICQNAQRGFASRRLAEALAFLRNDNGSITFKVIDLDGGVMVVKGNVNDLKGKWIFQPHVTRPKLFAPGLLTTNSMILETLDPEKQPIQTCDCLGGVRVFQLLSRDSVECSITLS